MNIANLIFNALGAIGVVAGVIFAVIEWREHKKIRNAKMLLEFSCIFENNPAVAAFIQKIDYGENWYDNGKFHDTNFEKTADYALGILCHFIRMIENKIIDEKDFNALQYIIQRTLRNSYTQKYFKFLIEFTNKSETTFPFEPLLRYGREHRLLNDNFN